MKNLAYILFIGGLLSNLEVYAQTSNLGKMTVAEGTKFSTVAPFVNEATASFNNDGTAYFYSHFKNNGVVDHTPNLGLSQFIGTEVQEISGSEPAYFNDVLFDNSSAAIPFHLSGMISVDGGVSFFNGIVDNEHYNGVFEMNEAAYHINTEDFAHVNGPVNRAGNQDFTYPVGKKELYRPILVASINNPEAYYEGEYFLENSDHPDTPHKMSSDGIVRIDNQQYWNLEKMTGGEIDDEFVSLTYRDETTPQFIMDAIHNQTVTIVRWDKDLNMWVDQGGSVDFDNAMVTADVDGDGLFTFATLNEDLVSACHVIVYNAVTPNGDGFNDYFRIDSQGDCAQNLSVRIYNRWGVKVFESDNYGEGGDLFDGYSTGRATIKSSNQLPSGTYFYTLEYDYELDSGGIGREQKAGYLYLSTDKGN